MLVAHQVYWMVMVKPHSILVIHHMTCSASGILAPGMICCFPSRELRFFRCFNRWTFCLMIPRQPCVYSMWSLHNMQLAVPGISTFLVWSFNTIESRPWVLLSFGNLEAGSGIDTLVSSHSHRHLFGMSFSVAWGFFSCSSLCLSMIIFLEKRIKEMMN